MSSPPDAETPEGTGYIRGGGGVQVDRGRLARVLLSVAAVVLAGVSIGLAVSAANENSSAARFRTAVPVALTVTGCEGISSGIGMAIEYWECHASYTFGGRHYNEAIGGSRDRLATGQVMSGRVVPKDPSSISLAGVSPARGSYVGPVALGAVALGALVLLLVSWRRR